MADIHMLIVADHFAVVVVIENFIERPGQENGGNAKSHGKQGNSLFLFVGHFVPQNSFCENGCGEKLALGKSKLFKENLFFRNAYRS